jgi:hypothetical protein
LMRMRIDWSIVYPGTSVAGIQRTSLDSLLGVGCPRTARGQHGGELLADLAVGGVEVHVPGVGVDACDAGDLAFDAGFLEFPIEWACCRRWR